MAITKSQLINSVSGINALADSIHAEGTKLDSMIHIALASATVNAHVSGDYTTINRLIAKLTSGIRTNAARAFIEHYAPVTFDKKAKEFIFNKHKRNEAFMDSELCQEMCDTVWTKFKPEPEYKPLDMAKAVEQLLKRAVDRKDDEREAISDAQIALINEMQVRMAQLVANEKLEAETAKTQAALAEQPAVEETN